MTDVSVIKSIISFRAVSMAKTVTKIKRAKRTGEYWDFIYLLSN